MAKIAEDLRLSDSEFEQMMQQESRLRIATIGPETDINLGQELEGRYTRLGSEYEDVGG